MKVKRREMLLLVASGIIVLVLVYHLLVISPALSRQEALVRHIANKEADLKKIRSLSNEWERFQRSRTEAEKMLKQRGERFTLLSYLEGISRQLGINSKIHYMKPLTFQDELKGSIRPEGIEIKLDGVATRELIPFLQRIEHAGKLLNIRRIRIQRTSKEGEDYLSVTLQVHTYV
ncbi:MAG: type II secretion system protein GspM [Desulfatiglandales bacterium]